MLHFEIWQDQIIAQLLKSIKSPINFHTMAQIQQLYQVVVQSRFCSALVCVVKLLRTHTAAIKLGQSPLQCSSNICDAKLAPEPETTTIRPGCQITFHALKRRGAEREREREQLLTGVALC
jgi:hypothetical protein